MAVTDLVANYGGVGDGQRVSVTGSITSGASPVFTPASNIFAANGGDPTGKMCYLNASGFQYEEATITAYNAGTGAITLNGSNPTVKTSVTFDVLWGTDNTTAFLAYRTWAQGLGTAQANLTIPAGRFCCRLNPQNPLNKGVQNSLITGPSGAPSTCIISILSASELRLGGDVPVIFKGLTNAAGQTARLNSTTAGAFTATLVDKTGYGSRITVGSDCFVTGYDTQSVGAGDFGYPPNPYFYETNKITGYDSGTGTITFQNPLAYAYKSDWPNWSTGVNNPDQGGPATIYVLTDYDRVVEIKDITLDSPYNQIACLGKSVILRNVRHTGYGVYPTQNTTFEAYDTVVSVNYEMDKIVGSVLLNNCTIGILQIQSASPNLLTITGGSVRHLTGTNKRLVMNGVTMAGPTAGVDWQIQLGCGYGRCDSVSLASITNLDLLSSGAGLVQGIHGGGWSATMPMSNGIFTFLKSENDGVGGYDNPGRAFMPGSWIALDNKQYIQIQRVWEDGTYVYHQTNLTGGWPFTVVTGYPHPCPDFTMRTCSGADLQIEDYNQAPARIGWRSYSKRTYVDGPSGTTLYRDVGLPIIGKLRTATFTVTPTGAATFHHSQFDNNTVMKINASYATATFAPIINGATAGTRTLADSVAATGLQSGDSVPDLAALGPVWFSGTTFNGQVFNVNNTTAVVVAEFILDQGIPPAVPTAVAPLRLRLRAA